MKKIIVALVMFLLMPSTVYGKEYYSEYKLYLQNTKEDLKETELLKKERLIYYYNYKYGVLKENYFEKNKNTEEYNKIDEEDFIVEKLALSNPEKNTKENITIKIDEDKKIRHFLLNNFEVKNTKIKKITVYTQEKEVDYFFNNLSYDINENIPSDAYMIIRLDDYYQLSELKINILFETEDIDENINFRLMASEDFGFLGYYSVSLTRLNLNEELNIYFSDEEVKPYYEKEVVKYKYYSLGILDSSYELNEKEGYVFDLNKYIVKYDYYKRNKIIVADYINTLDDPLIIYTSADIYSVSNIDFSENGTQKVTICFTKEDCFYKDIIINIQKKKTYPKKTNLIVEEITTKKLENKKEIITPINKTVENNNKVFIKTGIFIILMIYQIIKEMFKRKKHA